MAARQQNSSGLSETLAELTITEVKVTDKELGRGADATVMEVQWKGGFYAGKQLHDFHMKDNNCVKSFTVECKRWSDLEHSKIVKFFGVHFKPNSSIPMLILEKMDTTLWKYLQTHDKESFPLTSKVYVLRQAGEALAYLHGLSPPLIHCDLSPNNILLNRNTLETKVTDFGMSRAVDTSKSTHKSSVKGTQAFIAPEAQVVPPKYDEKRDVFSYGNVIVTMLTHEWPHPGPPTGYDDDDELVPYTEFQRRQEHLDKFTPQEREFFLSIIEKCLLNRPKKRPTSREVMKEMIIIEKAIEASVPQVEQPVHLPVTPPPDSSSHVTDPSSTPASTGSTPASHVTDPSHSTTSSHETDPSYRESAAEDFQSKPFMEKYKDTFLEVVDARAIRMKLQIDGVIPEGLSYKMDNTSNNEATEQLYVHLHSHATSNVIHKLCDAMTNKSGYPKMIKLGQIMKSDKDLPPYIKKSKVQQQVDTNTDNSPATVVGVKRLHEDTGPAKTTGSLGPARQDTLEEFYKKTPTDPELLKVVEEFPVWDKIAISLGVPINHVEAFQMQHMGGVKALSYWKNGRSGKDYPSTWGFLLKVVEDKMGSKPAKDLLELARKV